MAYTTINKSTDYFNTVLYTGNGASTHQITGVGFQPDWNWHKIRNDTDWHMVNDAVRGANYAIYPNANNAEGNVPTGLKSFDSDGFTVGSLNDSNQNNGTFVSWNWKANGAGSANTDGSISSTVSVNTTSGFSIVKYVGTGSGSNSTVGHGLGVTPSIIIVKSLDSVTDWVVWNKDLPSQTNNYLRLNTNQAIGTTTNYWNSSAPTNQVFGVSPDGYNNNKSGEDTIAYCFAEKQGYSKFGSYVGNGNADGTFVYTGFKPAFVIAKTYTTTDDWRMVTQNVNTRNVTSNEIDKTLMAHTNAAESGTGVDFVSNGMKIRNTSGGINGSGRGFIYMAFAEQPLVGDNPATAR